jgi:hypothetical protein
MPEVPITASGLLYGELVMYVPGVGTGMMVR